MTNADIKRTFQHFRFTDWFVFCLYLLIYILLFRIAQKFRSNPVLRGSFSFCRHPPLISTCDEGDAKVWRMYNWTQGSFPVFSTACKGLIDSRRSREGHFLCCCSCKPCLTSRQGGFCDFLDQTVVSEVSESITRCHKCSGWTSVGWWSSLWLMWKIEMVLNCSVHEEFVYWIQTRSEHISWELHVFLLYQSKT